MGLSFSIAAGFRQHSHSQVRVPRELMTTFLLSQIRDSPNLEGQVLIFISPRNRMAQLYPQALGSLFNTLTTRRATVDVFDHASTWDWLSYNLVSRLQHLDTDYIENAALILLRLCLLLQERVYWAVAQKRPRYIRPSHGRCIATAPARYNIDRRHWLLGGTRCFHLYGRRFFYSEDRGNRFLRNVYLPNSHSDTSLKTKILVLAAGI
jgi:hypothetical protein